MIIRVYLGPSEGPAGGWGGRLHHDSHRSLPLSGLGPSAGPDGGAGGACTLRATAAAVGPRPSAEGPGRGGRGGIDWVGIQIGKVQRQNRR